MTSQDEIQFLRLQKRNAELFAENVRLKDRCEKLQKMHEANQKHINALKIKIGNSAKQRAEAYFSEGQG